MSDFAIAVFSEHLRRATAPVVLEVSLSESDEFRRVATEHGWLFHAEERGGGWVRITCKPAPAGRPS